MVSYYNRADSYLQDSLVKEEVREEALTEIYKRLRKAERENSINDLLPPDELARFLVEEIKQEEEIPGIKEYFIWEVIAAFLAFYLAFEALLYLIRGMTGPQPLGWEVLVLAALAPLALWTLVGIVNRITFSEIRRWQLKWYVVGFAITLAIMIIIGCYSEAWITVKPLFMVTPAAQLIGAALLILSALFVYRLRNRLQQKRA